MGSVEHAVDELLSLATDLSSIVQELWRNIETSGLILHACDETLRLRVSLEKTAGKACQPVLDTLHSVLGHETLRSFPLRASTDCSAQTQLSRVRPHPTPPEQRLH